MIASNKHSVAPKVVLEFLQKTLPFNELNASELRSLCRGCVIALYPKGFKIIRQQESGVRNLFLIQQGGVKLYVESGGAVEELRDFRGEGGTFGALAMAKEAPSDVTVEAVEDTFCFLFGKEAFLDLIDSNDKFAQFFLETFSEEFIGDAYSQLRCEKVQLKAEDALYLFSTKVQALIKSLPQFIEGSATVQEAAASMTRLGIGSLLVRDCDGGLAGIITDTDLRNKVVAQGMDYRAPVEKVMAIPVHTISAEAVCFEVLLQFIRHGVDHLVVEHRKQILGVVTAMDVIAHQGAWPLYLFREIVAERDIESLYTLSGKIPMAVRSLIEQGARGGNITRVITLLNDSIAERALGLLLTQMGPPPVPFAWLTLGSDGRREQTFSTDQDNALVYGNPADDSAANAAEIYFEAFTQQAAEHLVACGYPRCKRGTMASNPRWRKPYSVWMAYFDEWLTSPEPQEVALAEVFFDFRSVLGSTALARALRTRLTDQAQRQPMFLSHLASHCLLSWPPLSFFRDFIVEKDGGRTVRFDLKIRGLLPFVNFARLMALSYGVEETSTLDRLRILGERGHISEQLYADAREAYEFLIQLRLVHQLKVVEAGLAPDSFIEPSQLSNIERKTLKETFGVIDRMLAAIKQEFPSAL